MLSCNILSILAINTSIVFLPPKLKSRSHGIVIHHELRLGDLEQNAEEQQRQTVQRWLNTSRLQGSKSKKTEASSHGCRTLGMASPPGPTGRHPVPPALVLSVLFSVFYGLPLNPKLVVLAASELRDLPVFLTQASSQHCGYKCMQGRAWLFTWVLRSGLRSSCLRNKSHVSTSQTIALLSRVT